MTDVIQRSIKGNIVYVDESAHLSRLIDAIGPDVIKYDAKNGDFGETAGDPAGWTTTVVEVGTGTSEANGSATAGKAIDLITAANENDGVSTQMGGSVFELTSGQESYFGIKFQINDVTQCDFFLGLAVTDTAILGGVADRIGFESLDGSTDLKFVLEKSTTQTLTAALATLVDATDIECEFYWDGAAIEVFVNGVSVATPAITNLPDDVSMRLSLELLTGEAVAQTMIIESLRIIQIGR